MPGIPVDAMQEEKAIQNGYADLGSKFHSSTSLAAHDEAYLRLHQVDQTVGNAVEFAGEKNALLPLQLAARQQLLPPMLLEH